MGVLGPEIKFMNSEITETNKTCKNHKFHYRNKEERVCVICGETEIYFGINRYDYYGRDEDWRTKFIDSSTLR